MDARTRTLNFTRRHAAATLLLLLLVLGAVAWLTVRLARSPRIDHDRVYRIGYGNDSPFHFKGADGRPSGLAVSLMSEAARRTHLKLQWVEGTGFDQSRMDLWVLMTVRADRAAVMYFTEPYLQAESSFLVRADSPVQDVSELKNARISYRGLQIVRDILVQLEPNARLVHASDTAGAIACLANGQCDAAFVDQHAIMSALLQSGLRTPLRMLPTRYERRPLALASTFPLAPVADELRRGIQQMTDDNSSTLLTEQWTLFFDPATAVIGEVAHQQAQVHQLWIGLIVLSTVIAVMVALVVWSRLQTFRLQQTRKLLRDVADRVPGLVYQYHLKADGTSSFPYASEAIRTIYRTSPESVATDAGPVFAALHPEDVGKVTDSILQSARDLTPWKQDYRVKFGDGTVRWLAGASLPQRERDGSTLWHGFITDVTDAKAAEAAMQAFERKIQETQKLESLGLLAGGIAHDFNNILTGILGNMSLAGHSLPTDAPEQEYLESIKQGCLRAADLCKQMLAYSGKGRFVIRKVSLNTLVEETTQLLRLSISKQAELRFNLAPNLPPIAADTSQIHQVVMNLVINASEAIDDANGRITLATSLVRVPENRPAGGPEVPAGTYVCLEVSDTGCGISAETQTRIFDPFFTTKFTGRGLGLAAVHGIVRAHQGALTVESQLGRGTTFRVFFPTVDGTVDPVANAGTAKSPEEWRGRGCILVVDDEDSVRRTVATMLTRLTFTVVTAGDGREGLELFRADPDRFSLVLLDLTMPQMDGKKAFAELQQIRAEVRVVLMSGFNEEEAAPEFAGKKLAGFLQKPFDFPTFIEVIRRAVG